MTRATDSKPAAAAHLRHPGGAPVRIGIIGLGYVGLPLAVEFARRYDVVGFDVKATRVAELKAGRDSTLEVSRAELRAAKRLNLATDPAALRRCNVFIVTVPTPVDEFKRPDFAPLIGASTTVGRCLRTGTIVIYESTVYPGATEEVCVPVLARESGLAFNHDFFAGYSPERVNPGDKEHRFVTIRKITSGSTPAVADFVDRLYGSILQAGTHRASSIRVAEAAKIIENTQRDVNIALVNELALIFHRLGIDTLEVLEAAGTKWNFLPFRPGLVGGHCIGVDPYYLTHKAQSLGYHPEVILAGRRINDNMGAHLAGRVVKRMLQKHIAVRGSRILVMGLTFKENCPDVRNTRVVDIVREFETYGARVDVWDPWVKPREAEHEHGLRPIARPRRGTYDAIVLAVAHRQFRDLGARAIHALGRRPHVLFDIKGVLPAASVDERL